MKKVILSLAIDLAPALMNFSFYAGPVLTVFKEAEMFRYKVDSATFNFVSSAHLHWLQQLYTASVSIDRCQHRQ